jgi:hypothetical protein
VVARLTNGCRSWRRHFRYDLKGLKDHAIGSFDLAVALGVGDQVVDVEGPIRRPERGGGVNGSR